MSFAVTESARLLATAIPVAVQSLGWERTGLERLSTERPLYRWKQVELEASPLYVIRLQTPLCREQHNGQPSWALQSEVAYWSYLGYPATYVDLRALAACECNSRGAGRDILRGLQDRYALAVDFWDARLGNLLCRQIADALLDRIEDARPVMVSAGQPLRSLHARCSVEQHLLAVLSSQTHEERADG